MSYQSQMLDLGREIFQCKYYKGDSSERCDCYDTDDDKHGPEMSFVGSKYGSNGSLRILFTRINPVWPPDVGFMGTRESISAYEKQNPQAAPERIFNAYLDDWKYKNRKYQGMKYAGTVTGHPNNNKGRSDRQLEYSVENPRYGIQIIMELLANCGIFSKSDDNVLQFCAINNVVKCAGPETSSANPSSRMYQNCRKCNYYIKEINILKPHIVVAFSGNADKQLQQITADAVKQDEKMVTGFPICYFMFPYPLRQAASNWKGAGTDLSLLASTPDNNIDDIYRESFKVCQDEHLNNLLWRHVMHLVSEAKRLSNETG
jgi:hypothetical protein